MNNKIIEFPAQEAGAKQTIASEAELAKAVGNESVSTYGYQGKEKDNDKIIPFPGKKRPQISYIETCAGIGATSLALKEVGEQLDVVIADGVVGNGRSDEVAWDYLGALVDELVEGVLAVGACLAPDNRAGLVVNGVAVSVNGLAV